MLESMSAHLRAGFPLLVFPEGHRSLPDRLRRFRRGAVYAAARANVPIVLLYVWLDRPYLTSNISIWRPPTVAPKWHFECFDPILPEALDRDAKRIHEHVEQLYQTRHAQPSSGA
jgi:1-acyl-sn-glycerol-3-phosphate acyltransferase